MTEFISRKYGNEGYEIIIKTDSHEHYKATEKFARQLIDHAKPMTNFERITKTPLRLAQFFQLRLDCYYCPARIDGIRNCEKVCKEVLRRWLEEESGVQNDQL